MPSLYCGECGKPLNSNVAFCAHCGWKIVHLEDLPPLSEPKTFDNTSQLAPSMPPPPSTH